MSAAELTGWQAYYRTVQREHDEQTGTIRS